MSDIRIKLALDGASAVVSGIERVKASFGGMSSSIAALSGTLGVAAFGALIKGAINAADALDEMGQRYGVSAKELSALQLSFKQAGMAPEAMAKSLGKLSLEMAKGGDGLAAIGVKARNADGTLRSTTEVLGDVADKFQGMQDGAGKTALAMEIFGKSGAEMVPLLNGGSEGIAEMSAQAERLGLVISDEAAAQAGNFNDTLELLGLGVQGVASQVAAQLLPTLSGLAGQFLQSMTSGDRLKKTADFLATGLKGLYVVGLGVVEIFSTVGTTLGGVSAAVVAALSGDFSGAANILREMKTDIGAGWKSTLAEMSAAWNTTGNASVEAMVKTVGATRAAAPDISKVGKAAKEVKDEFAELLNKLTAKDAGIDPSFYKDLETLHQGYVKGRIGVDGYREAVEKLIAGQQFAKDIAKEIAQALADAAAAQNKAYDDFEAAEAKQLKAVEDRIKAGRTMLEGLEQEIKVQGLSTKERQVATAMLELERQGVVKGTEAYDKYATQIRDAIEIKAANDEHLKMWESIDSTAHDVFVNIFEDGAGTFKRLGQTLKAALLDWLYQMTIKKWILNIQGQFSGSASGGGPAGAAGGGGFGGLDTWGGAALQAYGGYTAGASAASLGYANMVGAAGGDAIGALIAGNGGWAGVGATGGSVMSSIAAAAPYIAAFFAVVALAKKFKSPGEQHTGGFYSSSGATGMDAALGITDGNEPWARDLIKRANPEIEGMVKTTVESVIASTKANAKALGMDIAIGIDAGFAANTNGKAKNKNAFGYFDITINGETVAEYVNRTLGEDVNAAAAQWTQDMADAAAKWVLGGEEAWAAIALQGETASATLDRLALSIVSVNQMFDMLGHQINLVGLEGAKVAAEFAQLFGGLEQAQQAVGAYYAEFYSESERNAYATQQLTEMLGDLGQQMPATRDEFRAMVDAAIAAGDTDLAAKLIALSPAVASVIPPMEDLTATMRSAADIAQERAGLERELLQLQGNTAALRALDLAELDESNRALQEQIWALEDQKAAQQQATQAAQEAAQAAHQAAQAHQQYVSALASAGGTIASLIRDLKATMGGTADPMSVMRQRQADYLADLARARAGDVEASQRVAQSARAYLDAAQVVSGNDRQAATVAQVISELQNLPAVQTFEQQQLGLLTQVVANTYTTYTSVNTARQAIVETLAQQTDRLSDRISADFTKIDTNLDGKLTVAELQAALNGKATDAQIISLRNLIDADNDGIISKIEAQVAASNTFGTQVALSLGGKFDTLTATTGGLLKFDQFKVPFAGLATDAELKAIFAEIDANGDGVISKLESTNAALLGRIGLLQTSISTDFDTFDANGDGLTLTELQTALAGKASDAQIISLRNLIDTDNDGIISKLEATRAASTTFGNQVATSLGGKFDTLTATTGGLLKFDQFKVPFAGLASDAKLLSIFNELDTNGDGVISKLESIRAATAAEAAKGNVVVFDPNDPMRSIWSAIQTSVGWLQHIHGYQAHHYNQLNSLIGMTNVVAYEVRALAERSIGANGGIMVKSANRSGTAHWFATGGVFTNSIVNSATPFDFGVMGEAGAEAIMPLQRLPNGDLGVQATVPPMPTHADGMAVLVGEVRRLSGLVAQQEARLAAIDANTRAGAVGAVKSADSLGAIQRNGLAVHTEAGDVVATQEVTA